MRVGWLGRGALAILALCGTSLEAGAWQRPVAKPAPKLESCPEMGEGFVRVPGSATCLQLSGSVRVEALHLGGSGGASFNAGR